MANWKQGPDSYNITFEKFYFKPASELSVFDIEGVRLGQLICYDRHFPEAWRVLQLAGAEIVFVPVASNGPVLGDIFVAELRAMAFMHHCFVAAVNRVGVEEGFVYYGGSHLSDPFGRVLAGPAGQDEGVTSAKIDFGMITKAKKVLGFARDRRPDLYQDVLRTPETHA